MSRGQLRRVYPLPSPSDEGFAYQAEEEGGRFRVTLGDKEIALDISPDIFGEPPGAGWCRDMAGGMHRFAAAWVGDDLHLWLDGDVFIYRRVEAVRRRREGPDGGSADILAPMPGTVVDVLVQPGDPVDRNQTVMLMESMKMELVITAPRSGVVKRVPVEPGSQVDKGMRLLELE